ncbi:MAG TPA: hypothetical protein VHN77_15675 [Phycisphaerales bacterium]|nr:hypothetical protein [Phycisphaerales bacterium]
MTEAAWCEGTDLLRGALSDFAGGLAATIVWWAAWILHNRSQQAKQRLQKRQSISIEVALLLAWLRTLESEPSRGVTTFAHRGVTALSALVRLGPDITPGRSLEPSLGELEHRVAVVEALATRLFVETTGIARAMTDDTDLVSALKVSLTEAITEAKTSLKKFESAFMQP